ncbi:MAG: VOC family protein [Bacteroidota bacterium]|nr:VOC family protein [Bacteroidota bacterium]
MASSHIYPGAHTLNPYIVIKGCSDAIEFYINAFGAIERGRLMMPDGTIAHAEVEIEGSLLMMSDENLEWGSIGPHAIGGNPMTFGLYVMDADAVIQRAVDAGATLTRPVEDQFYGDRTGQILDPFGYKWMITTHKEDVSFEEMQKRSDQLFGGSEVK